MDMQKQPNNSLELYRAEYCPYNQCYYLELSSSGSVMNSAKLNNNHISAKETNINMLQKEEKQKDRKGKRRYIYAEQMLYLTYVQDYNKSHWQDRSLWQAAKNKDILRIIGNLKEKGYNKFEFAQFYIKMRKKSRQIQRFSSQISQSNSQILPFYKIYKTVQEFKQRQFGQTFFLAEKDQKLSNILKARKNYQSNYPLKIYILSTLDGITIISKPNFQIIFKKKE